MSVETDTFLKENKEWKKGSEYVKYNVLCQNLENKESDFWEKVTKYESGSTLKTD
jgi:hypothetical protein